jgi:chorismate-pyruvate lyase
MIGKGKALMKLQKYVSGPPLAALLLLGFTPESAQAQDAISRLAAEILAAPSATQALTARCARLGLADPASVHAERDRQTDRPASPEVRNLLQVGTEELVRYRRVRLICGDQVLSEADNWYVASRLTLAMNSSLDHTDVPFGTVVRPLNFHRQTLERERSPDPGHVLRVTALLSDAQGTPFSLVQENYTPILIRDDRP